MAKVTNGEVVTDCMNDNCPKWGVGGTGSSIGSTHFALCSAGYESFEKCQKEGAKKWLRKKSKKT